MFMSPLRRRFSVATTEARTALPDAAQVGAGQAVTMSGLGDVGYYVEHGGKGVGYIMDLMGQIHRSDRMRPRYCMAAFGQVDRRTHRRVHVADLVAHEVITQRHHSRPLDVLGDSLLIRDMEGDDIQELVSDMSKDRDKLDRLVRDNMARRRRDSSSLT